MLGVLVLLLIVVGLDQFVWRPLLAWADKFKMETVEGEQPPTSWFLNALDGSWLARRFRTSVAAPLRERADRLFASASADEAPRRPDRGRSRWLARTVAVLVVAAVVYGVVRAAAMLTAVPAAAWARIGTGVLATFARVVGVPGPGARLDHSGGLRHRHQAGGSRWCSNPWSRCSPRCRPRRCSR